MSTPQLPDPATTIEAVKAALEHAKAAPAAASQANEDDTGDIATPRARAATALEAAVRERMAWHAGRAEWVGVDLCRLLIELCLWHEHAQLRETILALQQRGVNLLAATPDGQPERGAVGDLEEEYLAIKPSEHDGAAIAAALGLSAEEARAFGLVGSFQPVSLDRDELPSDPAPAPPTPTHPETQAAVSMRMPASTWDMAAPHPDEEPRAAESGDEIEAVFRSEALAMVKKTLPKALLRFWAAQDSVEALLAMRDGFHVIKSNAHAAAKAAPPERSVALHALATLAEAAEDTIDMLLESGPDPSGTAPVLPPGAFSLLSETVIELEQHLREGRSHHNNARLLNRLEAIQRKSAAGNAGAVSPEPVQTTGQPAPGADPVLDSIPMAPGQSPPDHPLLPTFLDEADRLMLDLHRSLGLLSVNPTNEDALTRARIKLHTLKGNAGLIGGEVSKLQIIAHSAENLLELIEEFQSNGDLREVPSAADRINGCSQWVAGTLVDGVLDAEDALQALLDHLHRSSEGARSTESPLLPMPVADLAARLDAIAAQVRADMAGRGPTLEQPGDQTQPALSTGVKEDFPAPDRARAALATGARDAADMSSTEEIARHRAIDVGGLRRRTGAQSAAPHVVPTVPGIPRAIPLTSAFSDHPASVEREGHPVQEYGEERSVRVALSALEDLAVTRDALQELLRHMTAGRLELRRNSVRLRNLLDQVGGEVAGLRTDPQYTTARSGAWDVLEKEEYTPIDVLLMQLDEAMADLEESDERLRRELGEARAQVEIQNDAWLRAQRALLDMSMVPLSQMQDRLSHAVRSLSRRLRKQVAFTLEGGDLTLDGRIAESLFDPLMHLLNNAIDHGIEDNAAERMAAGKPAEGHITIRGRTSGDGIAIEVRDDGRGIDPDKVAALAVERGIMSAAEVAAMSIRERRALIWRPGFSTAPNITAISGRGIGMKSALDDITSLQGRIDVQSDVGVGTTFTITLPRSLAMLRVEVLREGADLVAVPITQVVATHPITYSELEHLRPGESIVLGDRAITIFGAHLAGGPVGDGEAGQALLVEVAGRGGAIAVDNVLGSQYLPVRPAHGYLRRHCGLLGYAIGGGGRILPILDLPTVIERAGEALPLLVVNQQELQPATVLAVDDSQTVRRALRTLFTRGGYQILEAADGREALTLCARAMPDLILLDMEMPGMDGLETLQALRTLPHGGATVPIFMITSRQQARHRAAALAGGATRYFAKPYDQDELLGAVQEAIARKGTTHGNAAS